MKNLIVTIAIMLAASASTVPGAAQTAKYVPKNYTVLPLANSNLNSYIGKSVAELLNDYGDSIASFVLNPNYNNPEYADEFRFSNMGVNETSTVLRNNANPFGSGKLHLLYVQFKPQIKYPTEGFIRENREKPLSRTQYAEFAKYKITGIIFSVFPR
jgi:hypothetical protein